MKSEKEIEQDILNITLEINKEFPELSKYILEMPVTVSDKEDVEVNVENLKEYYNSLKELVLKYREEQNN